MELGEKVGELAEQEWIMREVVTKAVQCFSNVLYKKDSESLLRFYIMGSGSLVLLLYLA